MEFRSDLMDSNGWQVLTNNVPGDGSLREIVDPGSFNRRFYRIIVRAGP